MPDRAPTEPELLTEEPILRNGRPAIRLRALARSRWVLAASAIAVVISVILLWSYYAVRETTDDAQIEAHIHPLSAKVGGTVVRVAVENNQEVAAGTVLLQMDPRDFQVAVERAQADLEEAEAMWQASQTQVPLTTETASSGLSEAEARLEEERAGLTAAQTEGEAAQAKLRSAQARLRETQANAEKASQDQQRMGQLISEGIISREQYDAAVAAANSLRAAVDAAQADAAAADLGTQVAERHVRQQQAKVTQSEAAIRNARTAPQQISIARARAASARARYEQAQANLQQAQLNLEYATVKTPVAGQVSKKTVEVGQVVQAGQPLLAIIPLEDVWVTANFKETQLRNMRPGQKVIITVDTYGGRKYEGHVHSIAAATGAKFSLLPPENATGNYVKVVQRIPVKILLEKGQDAEHLLRPGMSVVATVLVQ